MSLQEILSHADWEIHDAYRFREALACLDLNEIGVVITERDLAEHCWQDLLDAVARMCHGPNLIVASRLADERLWAELLNLGGYDLHTPFEASETIRVISLAWQQWSRSPSRPLSGKCQKPWRHCRFSSGIHAETIEQPQQRIENIGLSRGRLYGRLLIAIAAFGSSSLATGGSAMAYSARGNLRATRQQKRQVP